MDGKYIRAAEAVLNDLESRKGIGDALSGCDEETHHEILETIAKIIERVTK